MKFVALTLTAAAVSIVYSAPIESSPSWFNLAAEKAQYAFGASSNAGEESWPPIKPMVSSEALQSLVSEADLRIEASKLYKTSFYSVGMYGHPTRVIGSPGHFATLKHIEASLYTLGPYYNVTRQYFNATRGVIFKSGLAVENVNITEALPFDLTPPTPKKSWVTAPFVLISNQGCSLSDYPSIVNGSIALIERGVCAFGDKSELAGLAGAVAAIVYNNIPGEGVVSGTLGTPLPHQVATLGVSYELGNSWASQLSANISLSASAFVDSFVKNVTTYNVIAETKGGNPENVIMLSGHSDSVTAGPGINDDGSGTLSVLEIAKALSKFSVNNTVRFAWFAAEEEGLLGSDYYVSQLSTSDALKIRVYMDFDMLASPNYAYQVYDANNEENPNGSAELKQLFIDYYTSQGVNHTLIPFDGRSDYDAFVKNGIPGGGVAAGAEVLKTAKESEMFGGQAGVAFDSCYHQACDDIFNLNYVAWMMNSKLIAHAVGTYASSLEGFPLRNPIVAKNDGDYIYHGPNAIV